ncbi:hypothetical protein FRC02_000584 [Tulasnella sp. 418]|nr:hypothetical protein FRC02_000584 [Tulasnella sp. 418]
MRRAIAREFRTLKEVEESLVELMQKVFSRKIDSSSLQRYLDIQYPNHLEEIMEPPLWIRRLYEDHMEWNTAASGPKNGKIKDQFDYWLAAKDVEFVEAAIRQNTPHHQQSNSTMTISQLTNRFASFRMNENSLEESDADPLQGRIGEAPLHEDPKSAAESPLSFFKRLGLPGLPPIPVGRRGAEELQDDFMVWSMSRTERQALYSAWRDIIKQTDHEIQIQEFKKLREKHENTRKIIEAADNQDKVQVLRQAHIIGCTTNGAAKLTSLLKSVCPKVLLVEEAGQVLEAHILSSLVPSIQHMILIGDPQQLRPTLANYHLSADHPRGGEVYRFDQSLMERLWKMGFPMSNQTLYNTLVDHESVQSYPPVRGMAHNVFFLDHRHAEDGGGDESASKTNKYEVAMIKDLVLHFLRQGKYSGDRDIIVLCAYLGQLSLIRKELSKEVMTVIDERDAIQLIDHEENADPASLIDSDVVAEKVNVSKRVVIRTVDNFQGEEGTIVILSLVRNSGNNEQRRRPNIGFLKSDNRANVALSRARHGLYILGNSEDLSAQSPMWAKVVEEFRENNRIGDGFTIKCQRHPETHNNITQPGQITRLAPDGKLGTGR